MQILRLPEVITKTGRSRSTLYADIDAGKFPKPVKLGARAIGFVADEVEAWIAERIAEREAA